MLNDTDHRELLEACRALPAARGDYLVDDYVTNLILTVIDFQLRTVAVQRAHRFFVENRRPTIRTHEELKRALDTFADDKESLESAATFLWNYRLWTRARMLKDLVAFFGRIGVTDQPRLCEWASGSDFDRDFRGQVKGLGFAVYKWLIMRQGVETIKPDVHVRRFVEGVLKRPANDSEVVEVLERVARELQVKAYELDWRIWEGRPAGDIG